MLETTSLVTRSGDKVVSSNVFTSWVKKAPVDKVILVGTATVSSPSAASLGTTTPAGYTDLLVSYTYRIAFEGGGGQDFGLAAAIATLIFLLVGALAIVNLKATRMKFD